MTKKQRFNLAQEEIKLIINRLKKGYRPEKIILFGSFAHGKINESSDIDLLIVKNTSKNPWERQKEADKFIDHKFPVDFLVYTPRELKQRQEMRDSFIEEVINTGRVIYER